MMLRNIYTLTLNDLAIAFKNKTILLVIFIPFFVFVSLQLVDRGAKDVKKINIGLIRTEAYDPVIMQTIRKADSLFAVDQVADEREGTRWLREKRIDGLLLSHETEKNSLVLVVTEKGSLATLSIVESFSVLQKAAEGKSRNWIAAVKPLNTGGIQQQTLPTWILMLVLLVGFIIIPAQVAEEKEKQLLLALLQTPMREIEWLFAKLLSGMILILTAVLSLHLLSNSSPEYFLKYAAFLIVGSFCFSACGILLGFLCRSQASARTLGVLFYLPHLLPSALSEFSQQLTAVTPFVASSHLYNPIKAILLNEGSMSNLPLEWFYLFIIGLAALFCSQLLMKKRWLM